MKRLLATTALLCALAAPAMADVVLGGVTWTGAGSETLTLSAAVPGGNQPLNIQCVICGDNQPQQSPTFGYTDFENQGNLTDALEFSTNVPGGGNPGLNTVGLGYDGNFLRNYLLSTGDTSLTFSIGVDINDATGAGPEVLDSFFLLNLTTHTVLAAFNPAVGVPVPSQNNGTGFPDYTISGFNVQIGTDIHAGDQLIFFANLNNLSDGPDSFFLVPTPAAVPAPIVGAGLPGLFAGALGLWAFAKRRRNRLA